MADLRILRGGREVGPRPVLLHGLGAAAEVWTGLGAELLAAARGPVVVARGSTTPR